MIDRALCVSKIVSPMKYIMIDPRWNPPVSDLLSVFEIDFALVSVAVQQQRWIPVSHFQSHRTRQDPLLIIIPSSPLLQLKDDLVEKAKGYAQTHG